MDAKKWATKVRSRMHQKTVAWTSAMEVKLTLSLYRRHQHEITSETIFENSLGSRLLSDAWIEALRTLVHRCRFDPAVVMQNFWKFEVMEKNNERNGFFPQKIWKHLKIASTGIMKP